MVGSAERGAGRAVAVDAGLTHPPAACPGELDAVRSVGSLCLDGNAVHLGDGTGSRR